jgi:hypothetical protein
MFFSATGMANNFPVLPYFVFVFFCLKTVQKVEVFNILPCTVKVKVFKPRNQKPIGFLF